MLRKERRVGLRECVDKSWLGITLAQRLVEGKRIGIEEIEQRETQIEMIRNTTHNDNK